MGVTAEFNLGSEVRTDDGFSGELRRMVVAPAGRVLTHLIIAPRHQGGRRRLVPITMVGWTPDGLKLNCTTTEYEALVAADETEFVVDPSGDPSASPNAVLHRGDRAQATDAGVGRFQGLVVDADGNRVTHVVLDDGHLWNKRRIIVPIGFVTDVSDGVQIGLTKEQVKDLPQR